MNGKIGEFVAKYWWKIIVGVFLTGGLWNSVQGQLGDHSARLEKVEKDGQQCHDFMQRQDEVNKRIESIDKKLDRLLLRR